MADELEKYVKLLGNVLKDVEAEVNRMTGPGVKPHLVRYPSGTYILLDAYAAYVQGLAALEKRKNA